MPVTLVTAPAEYPVSLQEAKDHLRVTVSDDDMMIYTLIKAAVDQVEEYTRRKLITQTWDFFIDSFMTNIYLPYGNLQSVTSVKYYDVNDSLQTLATTIYIVDTDSYKGKVTRVTDQSWPSIYDRPNPIEIRFVCGYGGASAVPESFKSAIKIKLEMLYGNLFPNEYEQLKNTYEALLSPYRIYEFC